MTEMAAGQPVKPARPMARSEANLPDALRAHLVHWHRGEAAQGAGTGARLVPGHVPTGWTAVDRALEGGLMRGGVHEWIGTEPASSRGDGEEAVGRSGGRGTWAPATAIAAHLVRQAWQNRPGAVLWIGSAIRPSADVLRRTIAAEWLDGEISVRRTDDCILRSMLLVNLCSPAAVASAAELALARESAAAVTAIVLPGAGLRMPDVRRLQLAAERSRSEAGGPLVLVMRPPEEGAWPSPAVTRWRVSWSAPAASLARPAWRIELIKARPPQSARSGEWMVAVSDDDPGRLVSACFGEAACTSSPVREEEEGE